MRDHFLYPLFRKLRPKEAELNDQRAVQPFIEFFSAVYLSPFVIVGIIWLWAASDLRQIWLDPRGFVTLFISLLIIQSRPATVPLKLGNRGTIHLTISLASILVWVGMFIWGPVALVVDLIVLFILRIQEVWRRSRYTENTGWMLGPYFMQDISNTTLTSLIGITVYQAIGGKIPLDGLLFIDWVPAFIAMMVTAFFTVMIMLPIIIQINRLTNVTNNRASLGTFSFTVVRVLLITTPFAIPFTLLYTRATPSVNIFATIGLVLVNLLLHYLGRTNESSRQRTREMTQLEALGEEIIQSPADGSTLRELLAKYVERMFQDPRDILEIRIFEEISLPGFEGGAESIHLVHPAFRHRHLIQYGTISAIPVNLTC